MNGPTLYAFAELGANFALDHSPISSGTSKPALRPKDCVRKFPKARICDRLQAQLAQFCINSGYFTHSAYTISESL
jgi:hypothetical protein